MKYTQDDVKKLGTILCVWAHPDDESWCSVGLMRQALENGQRVVMVTATRGGSGKSSDEERWPSSELPFIREEEMLICLENLPGVEHRWLKYVDGTLPEVDIDEASDKILKIIDETGADTILTFEKGGITGHVDHKSVHLWSIEAVEKSASKPKLICAIQSLEKYESAGTKLDDKYDMYFNCDMPNCVGEYKADILIELNDNQLNCKMECLRAHQSQSNNLLNNEEDVALVKELISIECFSLYKK
jgi:LmbE family N-acetylglucosaminyl deacetylase